MIVDEAINYVEQHSVSIYIRNVTTDVECGDVFIQIETSMLNVNEDGCFDQDMILELLVDELEVEGDDDELNDFGLAALECFNVRNAIE